jgi:fatty acid desaturase
MTTRFFAHNRRDALLVGVALAQSAVLAYGALSFGAAPWGVSLALGLLSAFLICTNFMCVGHNFLHNPFFTSRRLNAAFSLFNSVLLGTPQTLHRIQHMHHHKYNNDAIDPETGTTRDYTSTYRSGRPPGLEEPLLRYALLGYFRVDHRYLATEVARRKLAAQLAAEVSTMVLALAALAALNPAGLLGFYLPVWFLGNMITQAENYLEHHGAVPGDRRRDSVSSYGRLYNLAWFNNGYHQEHHYRPQTHWTRLPEVTPLLPPEGERRVVRWAHWFNIGSHNSAEARRPSPDRQPATTT